MTLENTKPELVVLRQGIAPQMLTGRISKICCFTASNILQEWQSDIVYSEPPGNADWGELKSWTTEPKK